MLRRRYLDAAYAFKLETKTPHPPRKFPLAAAAAITFFAVILRLAYAWRLGASPPWPPVIASGAATWALAAVAARLGGRLAGAAAAFFWAVLPASIAASVFHPDVTYAACAGAFSLYFFAESAGPGRRVSVALWAGALVGAAAALSSSALALAAFYFLYSTYEAARKNGAGARAFTWLGGFVPVVAAAASLEYLRGGVPLAHLRGTLTAPGYVYAETDLLIRRLVADAAAMLFWDPFGFGFAVVVALAAGFYFLKNRRGDALFYGGLLVFTLTAHDFTTTSLLHYAPMALEPAKWLLAALPAAALGGAVIGELWWAGGQAGLGRWTGALGAAAVLATLFLNGNMPTAALTLLILALAVTITITLAGFARRQPEASRRRLARVAAALIILISLYPVVILYL